MNADWLKCKVSEEITDSDNTTQRPRSAKHANSSESEFEDDTEHMSPFLLMHYCNRMMLSLNGGQNCLIM